MKATRHNGRSGKHGSYNPKHNDRNFDLNHSEHIDANMAMQNIYWDCYTGKRTATSKEIMRASMQLNFVFMKKIMCFCNKSK